MLFCSDTRFCKSGIPQYMGFLLLPLIPVVPPLTKVSACGLPRISPGEKVTGVEEIHSARDRPFIAARRLPSEGGTHEANRGDNGITDGAGRLRIDVPGGKYPGLRRGPMLRAAVRARPAGAQGRAGADDRALQRGRP